MTVYGNAKLEERHQGTLSPSEKHQINRRKLAKRGPLRMRVLEFVLQCIYAAVLLQDPCDASKRASTPLWPPYEPHRTHMYYLTTYLSVP